ncbi:hypothetical protein [Streptomyces sp. NPDC093097]|uniref:hypothetical protein n=1 Tax=Streptomyces sp. NPDC093097 TaxID=3366027 RepID=UPI00382E6126
MTTRRTLTALGAGLANAGPASAGGVIAVLSPSMDNTCAELGKAMRHTAGTTHGSGTADGLLTALLIDSPLNHCGGADIPLPAEKQQAFTGIAMPLRGGKNV